MRYAVFSDVHANEAALRVMLQDAADAHAERLICLGDVLGYGPEPVSALELVYRRAHVCLAGNHDDAVAGRFPLEEFTDFAAAAAQRHQQALTKEAIDWLRRLPHECEFDGFNGDHAGAFACAHGDFSDPKGYNYVLTPEDAMPSFLERDEPLLFVGHTHRPEMFVLEADVVTVRDPEDFTLAPGVRYLVNVGSVGYPRSGVCRSSYCIYDDEARRVSFRSLPFDLDGYAEKMHGQGLDEAPWMYARRNERLRNGSVVRAQEHFGRRKAVKAPARSRPPAKPVEPTPRRPRPPVAAFVATGLMVAGAGVWCTSRLVRELPPKSVEVEIAEMPAPVGIPELPVDRPTRQLAAGWTAVLESSEYQDARIDSVPRRPGPAFHLRSDKSGTVRLVRELPIFERPDRIHWSVELLTPSMPGRAMKFQFHVHARFYDGQSRLLGEEHATARRSAMGRGITVPTGTEKAVMEIDCVLEGEFDMAVQYFGIAPERRHDNDRKRKRKVET